MRPDRCAESSTRSLPNDLARAASYNVRLNFGELLRERQSSLARGRWCASGVLAPALSEPKARSRAPARRLCDGVRRSRPTPRRQPEHRSHQTRSAAAASFARCIMVKVFYRQSGGAGSGGSPDKAGAYCEELKGLFGLVRQATGTSQSYPYCTVQVRSLLI